MSEIYDAGPRLFPLGQELAYQTPEFSPKIVAMENFTSSSLDDR